jgi:RNA polymerase sigma-70 factor (ECF subfamily)
MMAFAASRTARDAAEDVVQETLLVLESKYGGLERIEDLLPVSLQILRFKLMAARRKTARHGESSAIEAGEGRITDPGNDPEEAAARAEMLARLRAALRRLDPRCRELFRLKLEERSFPEIQVILGARSLNTVYTWDARCRRRLLELMGGRWEGERQ